MRKQSPRRREIVECALRLVRDEGFSGLKIKRIAECVGFSEAALYRHFHGKADLVAAMIEWLEEALIEPVRTIAEDESLTPKARLGAILQRHFSVVRAQRGLPVLLLAEAAAAQEPELLARTRTIFLTYRSLVADLLRAAGAADGESADHLALAFIGAPAALAIGLRLTGDADFSKGAEETLQPWLERVLCTARSTDGQQQPSEGEGR